MADIHLTLATKDYDHLQDLKSGAVKPEGISLTCLNMYPTDVFHRFLAYKEWEVSELSLGKYAALVAEGDADMIGLPVFPMRVFRQSSFYVRRDGTVSAPRDLVGKRCGVPEWAQSATVYVRGWLAHHAGVPLGSVDWVQAGANEAGRGEKVALSLPEDVRCRSVPDRSLNEMLSAGDLDCVISATPLHGTRGTAPKIVPLFSDSQAADEEYFRQTAIFPIMHLVVLRKDVYERHPWVAMNLLVAFEEAKRRSVERLMQASSRFAVPWMQPHLTRSSRLLFGDGEYWPYGFNPNRRTLETFLAYCHEQGICRRRLTPEELFAPATLSHVRH